MRATPRALAVMLAAAHTVVVGRSSCTPEQLATVIDDGTGVRGPRQREEPDLERAMHAF